MRAAEWLLWALIIALILIVFFAVTTQAYFISPRVPFSPSKGNVTYFLGDYVSNETLLYSDRIYLDGTWVVMNPITSTVNVTVMKINSTFQHFMLQNSSGDLSMSINTSGWSVSVKAEVFANDTSILNVTSNSSGWLNFLFTNFTGATTNLTISAEAIAEVILSWVVYPSVSLPSATIRLVVEITNQETNITSSFTAELNSTPPVTHPFNAYNQSQSIALLEAYNSTNITWMVAVPHNASTLTLTATASGNSVATASDTISFSVKETTAPPLASSTPGGSWYDPGEEIITITNTCLDDDNQPQSDTTSNVTVIMPNGSLWLDSAWMSENATGYFVLKRSTSTLSGLLGDYLVRTSCNTSSETASSNMRAFHLKNMGTFTWTHETRNLTNTTPSTLTAISNAITEIIEQVEDTEAALWTASSGPSVIKIDPWEHLYNPDICRPILFGSLILIAFFIGRSRKNSSRTSKFRNSIIKKLKRNT